MRLIRSLDHFLRSYSPMRLLRDFLRSSPAYTRGEYLTPREEAKPQQAAYRDDIYENREPDFGDGEQIYVQEREMDQHLSQLHPHVGGLFHTPQQEDMSNDDIIEHGHMSDAEQIERAIDAVKDGLMPIGFEHDPSDGLSGDPSHGHDTPEDDPYAEPFDAPFDEPFEDPWHDPEAIADHDPRAEPFDAPFDEPFDPSAGYPSFDAPDETLDDMVEEAYGDAADVQDDMYDDPYADPSLEDMVDDPMDEPDDMPEPDPEPEPMDPMDDPMHPYMPLGGLFPPGG